MAAPPSPRSGALNLYDTLKPRLVTAENIAQAAQFVDSANADAGLISLTSALTPRLSADGSYFVIPRDLYPPIEQGAVIVSQHQTARRRAQVPRLSPFARHSGPTRQVRPHAGQMTLMDWQAFALSLRLATFTTAILLAIAVPLAALIVLGRGRWLAAIEALATLPMVLPPTVLGFFLLVLLGPRTAFGRGITALLGHPLAFSFDGLVVGSVIYSLPFAVQPLVAGFASVDTALVDAARLLGAGPVRLVSSILVPLAHRSLLAAIVLSFLHTIGEFGVVLMLGGDIPGATRTLSIVLYDQVENFDYAAANRTAAVLLGLSALALAVVYATSKKRGSAQP